MGSERTTGTKVLSIAGDCRKPGVYEVPFGITPDELLEMAEADNPGAMLIGGPCRQMIGPDASTAASATTTWPPAARS
jgi:[NiFe] hydrogenase diaphorase moiety large subunit